MSRRFENGDWVGYYSLQGKRKQLILQLKFTYNTNIEGTAQDDTTRYTVKGKYKQTPPYSASLTFMDTAAVPTNTMVCSGFRESDTGGIFGSWKNSQGTTGGDFLIQPTKDKAAAKQLKELQHKNNVEQLKQMGFPEDMCSSALIQANGNLENAIMFLTQLDSTTATTTTGPARTSNADKPASNDKVRQLTEMGFSEEQSKFALDACDNQVERALELLFSSC